ncbi:unnamed protein product [Rotaria sp. Silwood2]|nr:unnamed protein product [Rotaria sp. Silwood2]CAF4277100.1 unnamed protein product [Rotaria sp. Silwood2]
MFLNNLHHSSNYNDSLYSQAMNESILNHLFLPLNLPSSNNSDYLTESNHQNEYKLLEYIDEFLQSPDVGNELSVLPILKKCIQNWLIVQNVKNCSVENLQSTIQKLKPDDFLPLYFYAQNAAILIEIDENSDDQPLVSSWQVLLPTETITSSLEPHISCFPVPTFRLSNRSQLLSRVQCELLVDFVNNTIECAQSHKASHTFNEIREVPIAHYVCQWWITQFQGVQTDQQANTSISFKKKHRDQIRYRSSMYPFRRSGLWMTIKVVFHIILTKRLGKMGTIMYKLLITNLLTYFIHKMSSQISTDLLTYCLRKIVRRLNKIDSLLSSVDFNDMNHWIQKITEEIKKKIEQITPNSNWQRSVEERKKQKLPEIRLDPTQRETQEHSCLKFKSYLQKHQSDTSFKPSYHTSNYDHWTSNRTVDQDNGLPTISFSNSYDDNTIKVQLIRIEIFVQSSLEDWINRFLASQNGYKCFENLQTFYEDYQRSALQFYYSENKSTDPMGYSRFILTSLTIIYFMHKKLCEDKQFERLKLHAIRIPNLLDLFDFLVLPNRDDMIRARSLYDYFQEFNGKPYPDLLSNIESSIAFGVYFADQSIEMNEELKKIQEQAEKDKKDKIEEVIKAKEKYEELMKKAEDLKCECDELTFFYKKCDQCTIRKEANNIKVNIYECPIPSRRESALAVMFELQMPKEIRCYRDILWQFINRPNPNPSNQMYEWLSTSPHSIKLRQFHKGSGKCKVKLVSETKSISQSHYSYPRQVASTSVEDFLYENSLQVQITPTKPTEFQHECQTLTPELTHCNYKDLQFSIGSTQFVQNRVIAELSKCSIKLKSTEFVEFSSFRSGHYLQWWNLLSILELYSLSMDEESVAILITHALLQNGPTMTNGKELIHSWCPESHQQLLDDYFVDELISRLDRHLKDCECNWKNELLLIIITIIVMRIFTICNSTRKDEITRVVLKCRNIGEKWIRLISESIQNAFSFTSDNMNSSRDKIVIIGIANVLTFSMYTDISKSLELSNENIISLLTTITAIHDNMTLSKKKTDMSVFMRNLLRYSERVLVLLHSTISKLLEKTSYESLNEFCSIYWAVIRTKDKMNVKWKKRTNDMYDGWYDSQYESNKVSIDVLRGKFLVNEMSIGFLPDRITSDKLFLRVFSHHIFEVQAAESKDTYITKHGYHSHSDGQVHYEFKYDERNNQLIVYERHIQNKQKFELIPPSCFEKELPDIFVSNYSHWWNAKDMTLQFRPIHFQDSNFLSNIHYILEIKTGRIRTYNNTKNIQYLINRSSTFFKSLFKCYFVRLDDEPYVYMLIVDAMIHIFLSRLGIAFKYNSQNNMITSREYSDMYIDENQWFGALTGLTAGLLLSPLSVKNDKDKHYLNRKLIVPYGQVQTTKTFKNDHQIVMIERNSTLTSSFLYKYFVFTLNDRLRILQPTDSPTGWLYLALLHAMTSYSLPDQYTGMTGMERSFQLLNSAGCWSDQPFDLISRNILLQMATISPKVNYYPEHLKCMQKVEWNTNSLPHSLQHFGYYLITKKLIETSEQLNFMHSSSTTSPDEIEKLFQSKKYNETLLTKLYWDYRDSYNPTARLSALMEAEIFRTNVAKPYQPVWECCPSTTNYTHCNLVDYLYSNGDVNLKNNTELRCFPLSQWLSSEYELKNIWIGLFKFIEEVKSADSDKRQDEIERYELLLGFLHYISGKGSSQPYYLQLLWSILKAPTLPLRPALYPSFSRYEHIQEISFQCNRINLGNLRYKRSIALQEIQDCFEKNCSYQNNNLPQINQISEKIYEINLLFQSWRKNRILRAFLKHIQSYLSSVTIVPFNIKVFVTPQQFTFESFQNHYRIRLNSTKQVIDQNMLESAKEKFLHSHSNYFIKPISRVQIKSEKKPFPEKIFPSTDSQINPLSDIANHFKEHLTESWEKFNSTEEYRNEYPSVKEINQFLDSFRQESAQLWNELEKFIICENQQLFNTGLVLRVLPTTLISVFQEIWLNDAESNFSTSNIVVNGRNPSSLFLTSEQRTLLGGIMVNWVVEQQIERALHFANQNKQEDFEKEISNIPHVNWTPSEHVPWLIMELEMNITIREIQIEVARHMIQPKKNEQNSTIRNIVMQLNMGEGKTSVILPMLALSLCSSSSSLVRIIVLKSLFSMNYEALRCKLGGLLNRRIVPFSCRRNMNFTDEQINKMFNRLQQGLTSYDIILTSPEDILSFDLLTIDKCRRNEFNVGRSMLLIQRWIKAYVRDILDESDEILHVKYQLIYSVGSQKQVDGGLERWKTIQLVLSIVKQHAANIAQKYKDNVFYKASKRQSSFPEFRLLNHQLFPELCQRIAKDWLNQQTFRHVDQQLILAFILHTNSSVDSLIDLFPHNIIQMLLIVRGLLSSEVLFMALKKRYRVNYGVNPNQKFNRLMAVPFRAKDVAAENTEFGHPDVAIVLTQLSYYYSGLKDEQMLKCFNHLTQSESDPDVIYEEWISLEEDAESISSIRQWKQVNLKDAQQRTQHLFPTLRQNNLVINYFLNHFVFPHESKQFPHKLVASPWDLSSSLRSKIITGFSGTNDTQLLLPIHICQYDLPELRKTDAIVLNNLLQPMNEHYQCLSIGANSDEILKQIVNHKPMIQVILDVGALFIDETNSQIAVKWLDLSDRVQIDYCVYFESDSIFVCDCQYQHHAFLTSPASERLDRCVFYLDEIHTRGTDFKFPNEFRAAVTLGNGLSKDRFVQACMRMRKLGKHHWLSFWSSNEVHQQIEMLKKNLSLSNKKENIDDQIILMDILRWVYENTQQATWDGLHHWATQSLSFQRKLAAFRDIQWTNSQQSFANSMMENLAKKCLELEVLELKSMYGVSKIYQTVLDIYLARYKHANICSSIEIHEAVSKQLKDYGGSKKLLTQLLDEEQQRELEREQELEEERQQFRPSPAVPCLPELHDTIKKLCNMQAPMLNLSALSSVFFPIADAFEGTTFYRECQPRCWQENLWVTKEFKRVIQTRGESLDPFLRPPRWIIVYRNQHIIFVSPLEANWLMGQLQSDYHKQSSNDLFTTTLRLLLPRTKRDQSIIVTTPTLTIPPSISVNRGAVAFPIPIEWLVELFVFNGTLYFESIQQQTAYCHCLGICPKPRTTFEEEAFEKGWILVDGFVENLEHRQRLQLHQCRFRSNPLVFIRKLIENRNQANAPLSSHVGSIITIALKRS